MKLYMHPASTTCRPVMLFAAEAKIPLENVVVDLMKGEHHGAAFVAINPNKLVPVLEDGDFRLTESSAILKYLADKVESPLYPREAKQRARVHERMDWFNSNFYKDWGYNLVYPQVFPHHTRPGDDVQKGTLEWGRQKASDALKVLDEHLLGKSKYLCGDSMTIADLFGAEILSTGELVGCKLDGFPNVKRWFESMKALPTWKQVNEVHEGFVGSLAGKPFLAL